MLRGLTRNVYLLGLLSLFNDLTSDMITPLLPAFLATMGLGAGFLGVMEGVSNSVSNLTKLFAGWYADRLGKNKSLTIFGYSLAAFVRPFLLIPLPAITFSVRLLDRIGKGIRTAPRDTLLTSELDEKKWGRAFGVQRAMDHTGALLAPPLAAFLLTFFSLKLELLFLIASIPAILSILFLQRFIQDDPKLIKSSFQKLSWNKLPPALKRYVIVIFFAAFSMPSELFLILKMQNQGLPLTQVPYVWFILTLFTLFSAFGGGFLADRWSRRKTMGLGWIIFALVYLGFAFNTNLNWAWLLIILYGIQSGLVEASERAFPVKIAGENMKATALGWYYFAYGMGLFPASFIFGILWNSTNASYAFLTYSLLSLIPVILLFFLPSDRQKKGPSE